MTSEHALEELYAGDPESFTERRDAIVKELKGAGDKDAAAALAKRRKPTQVAYVLNQLARKHPDDVAAFVDVGRALARAHRKALRGGGGGDLAEAIARQRAAVANLTARVASLLADLDVEPEGVLDKVAGALQAALIDPAAAAALEEGLLEKAPESPSSFGFGEEIAEEEPERTKAERTKATTAAKIAKLEEREPQRAAPGRRAPAARRRTAAEDAKAKRDDVKRARLEAKRERDEAKRQERAAAADARRRAREEERARLEQARTELAALIERAEAAEERAAKAVAEAKAARALVERAKANVRKRA